MADKARISTTSRQVVSLYKLRDFARAEPHFTTLLKRYRQTDDSSEILWLIKTCGIARLDPRKYSEPELDEIELNTMEEVHRSLPTKNDSGSFRGWVRQIARYQAYHLIRDREGQRRRAEFEIERRIERSFRFSSMIANDDDVANALAMLREDHAIVVRQWMSCSHNTAEVARQMGEPVGTIKSRLARALDQLRSILESPGHVHGQ